MNKLDEAVREYQAVIRLKPANAMAHLNLGMAQARAGESGKAVEQFEETLRLEPGNQQAQNYIRQFQSAKGREH